jgi:hypothetical protein
MNGFHDERIPTTKRFLYMNIFESLERISTLNISITWTNFNYEQIPALNSFRLEQFLSSNKFENERIPTLNIFEKMNRFPRWSFSN